MIKLISQCFNLRRIGLSSFFSLVVIIFLYFILLPEDGFLALQHPKVGSIFLGLILCLLGIVLCLLLVTLKFKKIYLSYRKKIKYTLNCKRLADQAIHEKNNFVATISHEIRNPMQAIFGIHELLLNDHSIPKDCRNLLLSAQQASTSLLEVLNQVLHLSKIEAGKNPPNFCPTNTKDLINNTLQPFISLVEKNHTELEVFLDPTLAPSLLLDPLRLRQILQNLLSNSIKFTRFGNIKVSCYVLCDSFAEQLLEISIADTGCGISTIDISRLIQPYEQGENILQKQSNGTGLGLSICQGLLKSMGSELIIDSHENLGTTVKFRLSLKRSSASPLLRPDAKFKTKGSQFDFVDNQGLSILLVDDHLACVEVLQYQMAQLGFNSMIAKSGFEALHILSKRTFDLIITDESMPQMSGQDLALQIKQLYPNIKVLGLTANFYSQKQKMNYMKFGFENVLTKPVDLLTLKNSINQIFTPPRFKTWDLLTLKKYAGNHQRTQFEIIQALLHTHQEIILDLKNLFSPVQEPEYRKLIHKIIGGAQIIHATKIISTCQKISQSRSYQDETLKTELIFELNNNNIELAEFLKINQK